MKAELYQSNIKFRGLSIEPHSSKSSLINACSKRLIHKKLHNHSSICTRQELGNPVKFPKVNTTALQHMQPAKQYSGHIDIPLKQFMVSLSGGY